MNIGQAITKIAEKTVDNTKELRKTRRQRRTEFTDLYGVPYTVEAVQSSGKYVAKFYISISPDLIYYLRYAFKIAIETEASDLDPDIYVHGVDIRPYLEEQQGGDWIEGSNIYPTKEIEDGEDFYDILDVANVLYSEGNDTDADNLLRPEFKQVRLESDYAFSATMFLYLKYNNMGR